MKDSKLPCRSDCSLRKLGVIHDASTSVPRRMTDLHATRPHYFNLVNTIISLNQKKYSKHSPIHL